MKKNIETGRDKKYMVNAAFVNPEEFLQLKLTKDANGQYIWKMIEEQLDVTIVPSNYVTTNTLVVGDMRFARLLSGTDYIVELGYVDDDFNKDLFTLKGKRYSNLLIREVDKTGFLKVADVEAAITAITTP